MMHLCHVMVFMIKYVKVLLGLGLSGTLFSVPLFLFSSVKVHYQSIQLDVSFKISLELG